MDTEKRTAGRPRKELPDYALMIEVSELYYRSKMTRGAIAKRMNLQTRKVADLLSQAERNQIVTINIERNLNREYDLERELQKKYPRLERALIVPSGPEGDLYKRLGEVGAVYLEELITARAPQPLRVAVTGGDTMLALANAMPSRERKNLWVHVAALIGHGALPNVNHVDPVAVASVLWARSNGLTGRIEFATVSPYDSKRPGREALQTVRKEIARVEVNTVVQEVLQNMETVDVVLGGVGVVSVQGTAAEKNRYTMEAYLRNIITPKALYDLGARGDYAYCPFGSDGNRVEDLTFFLTPGHRTWRRGIEFYKDMVKNAPQTRKKVVGFGGGFQFRALAIALEAAIINVIVTDVPTAERLLGLPSA